MHARVTARDDRPRGASHWRIPSLNSLVRSKQPGILNQGLEFGFVNSNRDYAGKEVGQAFPPESAGPPGGND
jgi:hypothetical protein